jgi:hypothetical protein
MILRRRSLPLLAVSALLAGLTFPAGSQARPNPSPAVAAAQLRLEQAQELRKAFVALAGANHTYHGHRTKAMHHVKEALKMLDHYVLTHGNPLQKEAIRQGRAAVAAAERAAASAPKVHMPRRASDASLRAAGQVLRDVCPGLDLHKQHDVRKQVNHAIHHINVAPKGR